MRCEIEDYQSAVVFVVVQFRWGLHDTRGPSLFWVYDTIVCWASLPLDTVQELADGRVALSLICDAIRVRLPPQFLDSRLLVHFLKGDAYAFCPQQSSGDRLALIGVLSLRRCVGLSRVVTSDSLECRHQHTYPA